METAITILIEKVFDRGGWGCFLGGEKCGDRIGYFFEVKQGERPLQKICICKPCMMTEQVKVPMILSISERS